LSFGLGSALSTCGHVVGVLPFYSGRPSRTSLLEPLALVDLGVACLELALGPLRRAHLLSGFFVAEGVVGCSHLFLAVPGLTPVASSSVVSGLDGPVVRNEGIGRIKTLARSSGRSGRLTNLHAGTVLIFHEYTSLQVAIGTACASLIFSSGHRSDGRMVVCMLLNLVSLSSGVFLGACSSGVEEVVGTLERPVSWARHFAVVFLDLVLKLNV